jgi:hypothetical protein
LYVVTMQSDRRFKIALISVSRQVSVS